MRMIRRYPGLVALLIVSCRNGVDGYDYTQYLSVCSEASIDVTGATVLCDSPGVFYYGSSGYRRSSTCKNGDKGSLTVTFDIIDELDEETPIYLTLSVFGGVTTVNVYNQAQLCTIGALKKTSGESCPYQGSFTISTKFYFEDGSNSNNDNGYNSHYLGDDDDTVSSSSPTSFFPIVTVGFASHKNSGEYDLGGANTDSCQGKSKNIQSEIQHIVGSSSLSKAGVYLLAFIGGIAVVGAIGGFAIYMWKNLPPCKAPSCCESDEFTHANYEFREYDITDDYDRKWKLMSKTDAAIMQL